MFTLQELEEKIRTPEGIEEVVFDENVKTARENFNKVLDRLPTRDRSVILYTGEAIMDFVAHYPMVLRDIPPEFNGMLTGFFYPTLYLFRYYKDYYQKLGRISEESLLAIPGLLETAKSLEMGKELDGLKDNKDFDETVLSLVSSFLNMTPIFATNILSVCDLVYQFYKNNYWMLFFENCRRKGCEFDTALMIPVLVAGFSEVKKSLFPNPDQIDEFTQGIVLDGRESANLFAGKVCYFLLHPELEPNCEANIEWEQRKERFITNTKDCNREFYEELVFLGDVLTKFTLRKSGEILSHIYSKGELKYAIDFYVTLLLLRKAGLEFDYDDVIICPSVQGDPDLEYLSEKLPLQEKVDFLPNSPQFDRLTRRMMENLIMFPRKFFEDLAFPITYIYGHLSGKLVEDFCYPLVGFGVEMKDAKKGMILLSAFMRAIVSLEPGDYWNGENSKTGVVTRTLN